MDTKFDCVHCGQHISIDESGADSAIECPGCYKIIWVPEKPKHEPSPLLRSSEAAPPPDSAPLTSGPEIKRRSGWAFLYTVSGVLWIVIGVGRAVQIATEERGDGQRTTALIWATVGIAAALQCFFFGFLIDVFTDIRWFLKKLVDAGNVDQVAPKTRQ